MNNKKLMQSGHQLSFNWWWNDEFISRILLFNALLCAFQHFSGKFSGRLHWTVYNFWKGIFHVPPSVTEKMQETGLTVFCSYPGQEYQTICRCHSLAAAHSPQIFYDSECWSGLGLEPSTSGALLRELTRQRYLRAYWHFLLLFTHMTDIDTPDTIDTWGAVTCHKPHNPLLTKSENRMLMAYVWKTHLS